MGAAMDLASTFLQLSVVHILMAMVPGPNTVVVSHCSAHMSRQSGFAAVAGVSVATCLWVLLSLLGVGAVLSQVGEFYRILRLVGAGYLVYVGLRMLRSGGAGHMRALQLGARSSFWAGFLTSISNPKSAIFWTSVFAVVLPAGAPLWFHFAVLALVTVQSALWYGSVALLLSAPASRSFYARLGKALNRLAGAFMIFFGLKIADDVRAEIAARAI